MDNSRPGRTEPTKVSRNQEARQGSLTQYLQLPELPPFLCGLLLRPGPSTPHPTIWLTSSDYSGARPAPPSVAAALPCRGRREALRDRHAFISPGTSSSSSRLETDLGMAVRVHSGKGGRTGSEDSPSGTWSQCISIASDAGALGFKEVQTHHTTR